MGKNNPRVFIEVTIGNRTGGRIYFELAKDICPKTVDNFIALLRGSIGIGNHTKKRVHYKGTNVFRVDQGVCIAMGDIEGKGGEGGESIYGPTFRDENYVRRHTQAGVLSMWTPRGRHTNGSSFMITLKPSRLFDGRNVSFGQVCGGMDVVRAIEQVPVTGDLKPRVDIVIVDCGVVDEKDVDTLPIETLPAQEQRMSAKYGRNRPLNMRESTKASGVLAGETLTEKADREQKEREEAGIEEEEVKLLGIKPGTSDAAASSTAPPPDDEPKFKNDIERRVYELRMKMNHGRQANNRAVLEEKKRNTDPDYEKKRAAKEWKERQEARAQKAEEGELKDSVTMVPQGKEYLADSAEICGKKISKEEARAKRKRDGAVFGWDVFNQDSLLRAHEKVLAKTEVQPEGYKEQKEKMGDEFYEGNSIQKFKATEEAKDRVAAYMQNAADRKAKFSRRRLHYDEEDVSGINEQNKHYNKKLQRAFKDDTNEFKQNLERGTAL